MLPDALQSAVAAAMTNVVVRLPVPPLGHGLELVEDQRPGRLGQDGGELLGDRRRAGRVGGQAEQREQRDERRRDPQDREERHAAGHGADLVVQPLHDGAAQDLPPRARRELGERDGAGGRLGALRGLRHGAELPGRPVVQSRSFVATPGRFTAHPQPTAAASTRGDHAARGGWCSCRDGAAATRSSSGERVPARPVRARRLAAVDGPGARPAPAARGARPAGAVAPVPTTAAGAPPAGPARRGRGARCRGGVRGVVGLLRQRARLGPGAGPAVGVGRAHRRRRGGRRRRVGTVAVVAAWAGRAGRAARAGVRGARAQPVGRAT